MTQINPKLTIISRRDLTAGYQAVQATHAAILFSYEHPIITKNWYQNSNYLAQLSVSNEEDLLILVEKLKSRNIAVSVFQEPDIDNQVTAIAIEPTEITKRLTSNLPLMLREYDQENKINKDRIVKKYN